jgi:putative membrane protein
VVDYDPHRWVRHLLDIRGSMVREISLRVLVCALFSAAVTYVHFRVRPVDISDKPHALIGVALGLLLVFRTNASYDRYWEGRKLWGVLVNEARNLGRRASVQLAAEPELLDRLLRSLMAFPYATMNSLRGEPGLGRGAELLRAADASRVLTAQHLPLAIARELSCDLLLALRRGTLHPLSHVALEADVGTLVSCLGGCERIVKTPLPFPYVVHLRRALVVYCFSLPFALVASLGWLSIGATTLIAYFVFGIEEIGVEIENPFEVEQNDLPLERICQTIESNLRVLLPVGAPASSPQKDPERSENA